MISGLCGGLGELLNVDVTLVRILLVVITPFTSGTVILIYFIVSLVVPKSPELFNPYQNNGSFGGPNGYGTHYNGPEGFNGPRGFNSTTHQQYRPDQSQYTSQRQWQPGAQQQQPPTGNMDDMMNELEKKALRKEIEELKKKLNEVEKKGE